MPDDDEEELGKCISWVTRDPAKDAFVMQLNTIKEEIVNEQACVKSDDKSTDGAQSGGQTNNSVAPKATLHSVKRSKADK